jgi:hypothetical protein
MTLKLRGREQPVANFLVVDTGLKTVDEISKALDLRMKNNFVRNP